MSTAIRVHHHIPAIGTDASLTKEHIARTPRVKQLIDVLERIRPEAKLEMLA